MTSKGTVRVYYLKFDSTDTEDRWKPLISTLPEHLQNNISEYLHFTDKRRVAGGKLLLKKALETNGFNASCLDKIKTGARGKPFIPDCFEFNISHSGDVVACAVSLDEPLGIDVERIRDVQYDYFLNHFSGSEWTFMNSSDNKRNSFFKCWTQKESVMKADGRGMYIPLLDIKLNPQKNRALLEDRNWMLFPLYLDISVVTHLCLGRAPQKIELTKLSKADLG